MVNYISFVCVLIVLVISGAIRYIDSQRKGYLVKPNGRFIQVWVKRPTRKEIILKLFKK